ncbi:MAG: ribbon-helix-helix domain-containing protein [Syntrophales bacterium]|nr:ribbon-helix-helix domain-containing protein [Syntrophales bacterium]
MTRKKEEIISFKVPEDLWARLKDMPNRSEFIRCAIYSALENVCPLCEGRGTLTEKQKEHWQEFTKFHTLERCTNGEGIIIKCQGNRNLS